LRNQVTGRARLIRPSVPPKKNSQRAQTVGVSVKMETATLPHPIKKRIMNEARYDRKGE
jgi:hypothetical protein